MTHLFLSARNSPPIQLPHPSVPLQLCPSHRCFSAALPALCRAMSAQALWGFCCTQCSLCPCISPAGWPRPPAPRSPALWPGHEGSDRSCKALPAAFPPSSEGQILSIAPTLRSLLPSTVTNSPGLGVSYLWQPARKEECTELPRPPFLQPHPPPPQLLS